MYTYIKWYVYIHNVFVVDYETAAYKNSRINQKIIESVFCIRPNLMYVLSFVCYCCTNWCMRCLRNKTLITWAFSISPIWLSLDVGSIYDRWNKNIIRATWIEVQRSICCDAVLACCACLPCLLAVHACLLAVLTVLVMLAVDAVLAGVLACYACLLRLLTVLACCACSLAVVSLFISVHT